MERHFPVVSRQFNIPCLIMANVYLDENSWYPSVSKCTNFSEKFSHSWDFLKQLNCMLQVGVSLLNRYFLFYNCEKIKADYCWSILYTLSCSLQSQKKPMQNSAKSRKNDFVEPYLLILLKSYVLLLQFLKTFLFSFHVFHYITKLQTEIQDRQITFRCEGTETFIIDLVVML